MITRKIFEMKRIAFYSDAETNVPPLLALALARPEKVVIDWYIEHPLSPISIGINPTSFIYQLRITSDNYNEVLPSVYLLNILQKLQFWFLPNHRSHRGLHLRGTNFFLIRNDEKFNALIDNLKKRKYDGLFISSIYFPRKFFIKLKTLGIPIFYQEYGHFAKAASCYDTGFENFKYLKAVFLQGHKNLEQSRHIKCRKIILGGARSDFFNHKSYFRAPRSSDFITYFNTVAGESLNHDNRLSQAERWLSILIESSHLAGYKFVFKPHPTTTRKYINLLKKYSEYFYINTYTADIIKQSTAIISDPSSIISEAILAKKPIFMPTISERIWKERGFYEPIIHFLGENPHKNAGIIKNTIKRVNAGSLQKLYSSYARKLWYKPDGKVSERIWRAVLNAL